MTADIQLAIMDADPHHHVQLERTLLPQLHTSEQARYRNFSHPQRRRLWLAGRMLLLAVLSRSGVQAEPAALRTGARGGVSHTGIALHLSLSHCRERLAAAVARVPVGVDIEWPRPRGLIAHAQQVFSVTEAEHLRTLPESRRQDAFYALWTLKEAACKASGLPLSACLRDAGFDLARGVFLPGAGFPGGDWRFLSACLEPGWRLALAWQGADTAIECLRLDAEQHWRTAEFSECSRYHAQR